MVEEKLKMIEARCKNCRLVVRSGNKLYCSKDALRRTFPYNYCLSFERPDEGEYKDGG